MGFVTVLCNVAMKDSLVTLLKVCMREETMGDEWDAY